MNFRELIQGGLRPGAYRLGAEANLDDLVRTARELSFPFFRIPVENCLSRSAFLKEAAGAMAFPKDFGHNWDAFYDYLTDLGWLPAKGYVVLLDGYDLLLKHDPKSLHTAIDVFRDACESWAACNVPMYVFFRGEADLAPLEPL